MAAIEQLDQQPGISPQVLRCVQHHLELEGGYSIHYQPSYEDVGHLAEVVHRLHLIEGISKPTYINVLSSELGALALGYINNPIIISGGCNEEVTEHISAEAHALKAHKQLQIIESSDLLNPIQILRNRGQNTKPRSDEYQVLPDGRLVPSYMGDSINDKQPHLRRPDPSRLELAVAQALAVEKAMISLSGGHIFSAHEALNLVLEKSFKRRDIFSQKLYLLSTDLPWVGVRTNSSDGKHVEMLEDIENPVAIKIDHKTTPEDILALKDKLNPHDKPGKLMFMIRIGLDHSDRFEPIIRAIKDNAPDSLIVYDIHGSIRKLEDGTKLRIVSEINEEIELLARVCRDLGLRLNGLHLETTTDEDRYECVDNVGDSPLHEGNVDPQLNPRQTLKVVNNAAASLNK